MLTAPILFCPVCLGLYQTIGRGKPLYSCKNNHVWHMFTGQVQEPRNSLGGDDEP